MIYSLPSISINNNRSQNFGFKVKVQEKGKLLDMADSYTFSFISRNAIEKFNAKAEKFFPEKTIILKSEIETPRPFESFKVDFFDGEKQIDSVIGYGAGGLLNYLKKATNPYTHVHSKFFYDGGFSPETAEKSRKIKRTCGTLAE